MSCCFCCCCSHNCCLACVITNLQGSLSGKDCVAFGLFVVVAFTVVVVVAVAATICAPLRVCHSATLVSICVIIQFN